MINQQQQQMKASACSHHLAIATKQISLASGEISQVYCVIYTGLLAHLI
jgi:hypothetical protein